MLSLFRNRKRAKATLNKTQDRIANTIVDTCLHWQTKWAMWMQKKSARLSGKTKFISLLIFILLTGGCSLYLIVQGFSVKQETIFSSTVIIKKPFVTHQPGLMQNRPFISKEEYQRINRFKMYMDSLARSPAGRDRYNSILNARPGLMDTVLIIDNIYQSQTKK